MRAHAVYIKLLIVFFSLLTTGFAALPVWTLTPADGTKIKQTIYLNQSSTVQYIVKNNSLRTKRLMIKQTPGVYQDKAINILPKSEATLTLTIIANALPNAGIHGGPFLCQVDSNDNPNPNLCYQPSKENILHITKVSSEGRATITVEPTDLSILIGERKSITVTNTSKSTGAAKNLTAIPSTSAIEVLNHCPELLSIGDSCQITFSPEQYIQSAIATVTGDNSNSIDVNITVSQQAIIQIDSPAEEGRMVGLDEDQATPLILKITNTSNITAEEIKLFPSDNCREELIISTSPDCESLTDSQNQQCTITLDLTTPTIDSLFTPCRVTIKGNNTNTLFSFIASLYSNQPAEYGGVVYELHPDDRKVKFTNVDLPLTPQWANGDDYIAGTNDKDDGQNNTSSIVNRDDICNDNDNCAAYACANSFTQPRLKYYLPAINELKAIRDAFCKQEQPGSWNCAFFFSPLTSAWSSTQDTNTNAFALAFSNIDGTSTSKKNKTNGLVCAQEYSY